MILRWNKLLFKEINYSFCACTGGRLFRDGRLYSLLQSFLLIQLPRNIHFTSFICQKTCIQHSKSTRKHVNEIKIEPGYSVSG